MEATTTKNTRLEARISQRQKEIFQKAAAIQGRSLSDFVVDAVQQKAEQVIHDHEIIVLTEEDRKVFFEALLNPPEPNEKLREAFELYRTMGIK